MTAAFQTDSVARFPGRVRVQSRRVRRGLGASVLTDAENFLLYGTTDPAQIAAIQKGNYALFGSSALPGVSVSNLTTGNLTADQLATLNQQAQQQIVQAATDPTTGQVDQGLVDYMVQGGIPPASVLAADPNAAAIPSLSNITSAAAGTSTSWLAWAIALVVGLMVWNAAT